MRLVLLNLTAIGSIKPKFRLVLSNL